MMVYRCDPLALFSWVALEWVVDCSNEKVEELGVLSISCSTQRYDRRVLEQAYPLTNQNVQERSAHHQSYLARTA